VRAAAVPLEPDESSSKLKPLQYGKLPFWSFLPEGHGSKTSEAVGYKAIREKGTIAYSSSSFGMRKTLELPRNSWRSSLARPRRADSIACDEACRSDCLDVRRAARR
jgi:hypothetical protein